MQIGSSTGTLSASVAQDAAQAQRMEAAMQSVQGEIGADTVDAAKKLEALFATMLVKEMRKALPNGFFGKTPGADTFNGWFDEKLGQSLADSGALDLAGQISVSLQAKEAAAAQ